MSCETTHIVRIRIRRDTAARWNSFNPILCLGEIGYDSTVNNLKIGDGTSRWSQLNYLAAGTGGTVWGGIIGDITDQVDLINYIGGQEVTDSDDRDALKLGDNFVNPLSPTDPYYPIMTDNIPTGYNEHSYYIGFNTQNGGRDLYKYEWEKIDSSYFWVRKIIAFSVPTS
jgi:hypothetical protein